MPPLLKTFIKTQSKVELIVVSQEKDFLLSSPTSILYP